MYRAFRLDIENWTTNERHHDAGLQLLQAQRKSARDTLARFISVDKIIDGVTVQEEWFPQFTADIFISHSHANRKSAINLAGWLQTELGLTAFVDSSIWGDGDQLLKKLDNAFCYDEKRNVYDYETRNVSTAHVHMMLASAIMQMIYKTECLFFLNTPNSISSSSIIETTTTSPWLYAEITMANHLHRPLEAHREEDLLEKAEFAERMYSIPVCYPVNFKQFSSLESRDLTNWLRQCNRLEEHRLNLDVLYSQHELPSK